MVHSLLLRHLGADSVDGQRLVVYGQCAALCHHQICRQHGVGIFAFGEPQYGGQSAFAPH